MAHEGRQPAMPFGYAFGNLEDLQNHGTPHPPGQPLLSTNETSRLGNFFSNPDDPNMSSTEFNGGFDFEGGSSLFGWTTVDNLAASSWSTPTPHDFHTHNAVPSPQDYRPQSSQAATPVPQNGQIMGRQAINGASGAGGSNLDESGHMGANALFNLSQNSPAMDRHLGQRRYSEIIPSQHVYRGLQNPQLLNATRYPVTNQPYRMLQAPMQGMHMANFDGAMAPHVQPLSAVLGARNMRIPQSLQFNSDANFIHTDNTVYTTGPQLSEDDKHVQDLLNAAYPEAFESVQEVVPASPATNHPIAQHYDKTKLFKQLQADEKAVENLVYNAYPSFRPHPTLLSDSANTMAPPRSSDQARASHVQQTTAANGSASEESDSQVKRRRTQSFPAQSAGRPDVLESSPAPFYGKTEPGQTPGGSAATSPSASHSDSPSAKAGASSRSKRRTSQAQSGTPQPASSKRMKLSDKQRKENHIQSEKRRRAEMKKGYDSLDKLVPSLKSGGLSKAQILQQTVVFLESLVAGNKKAQKELDRRMAAAGQAGAGGTSGWRSAGSS